MYLLAVQILFFVIIGLSIYKRDYAIFFYTCFLPLNTILPNSYNILGTISFPLIISFASLIHLILWKTESVNTIFKRLSLTLALIFLLYLIYSEIRNIILGILPFVRNQNMVTETLRLLVKWVPLILLTQKMNRDYFEKVVMNGIVLSTLILSFSVAFSTELGNLGFKIGTYSTNFSNENFQGNRSLFRRNEGFLAEGDVNVLGAIFNMVIGFCLSFYSLKEIFRKVKFHLCMIACVIGIVLTGSRMAILTFFILLGFYWIKTRQVSLRINLLWMAVIFLFLLYHLGFLDYVIYRFTNQDSISELSINERYSRVTRWFGFISYSIKTLPRIFFGYDSIFYFVGHTYRDPHNLYIRMFYYGGIVFVLFFIYYMGKILLISVRKENRYNGLLCLLPCIISSFIISQHTWIYFMLLFISINSKDDSNS